MIELPLVLVTNAWSGMVFGAICLVASLVAARTAWRSDGTKRLHAAIATLMIIGLGVLLLVQHLGWELQVDEIGIALRAPFDPVWRGGQVAWVEMTSVDIFDQPDRGHNFVLRVSGRDGLGFMVSNADKLPPAFVAALQKTVAERAPQVTDVKDLVGHFNYARQNSDSLISDSYSAHDGRGNALQ